jgi:hypothetical protein
MGLFEMFAPIDKANELAVKGSINWCFVVGCNCLFVLSISMGGGAGGMAIRY